MQVTSLPGYGPVKQTQFAGYIGLNDTDGGQLWYWFIAADSADWRSMPTVAWYQGGPGSSSLYGWFQVPGVPRPPAVCAVCIFCKKYVWLR